MWVWMCPPELEPRRAVCPPRLDPTDDGGDEQPPSFEACCTLTEAIVSVNALLIEGSQDETSLLTQVAYKSKAPQGSLPRELLIVVKHVFKLPWMTVTSQALAIRASPSMKYTLVMNFKAILILLANVAAPTDEILMQV